MSMSNNWFNSVGNAARKKRYPQNSGIGHKQTLFFLPWPQNGRRRLVLSIAVNFHKYAAFLSTRQEARTERRGIGKEWTDLITVGLSLWISHSRVSSRRRLRRPRWLELSPSKTLTLDFMTPAERFDIPREGRGKRLGERALR